MAISTISLGLQESAVDYANTTLAEMNNALIDMYGVDVMWFRSIPQKRSTDVIFQTYTLHNVENCPLEIKVIYSDQSYDDAALTFSMNGISYKPTLTFEIPVGYWYESTNHDGTLPQTKDIVFVPQTKKLWQVASMTPVAAIGGQITSFKMMMETYVPEADRYIGDDLKETLDETTVSVDKLFGKAIENTIKDIVDEPQTSNKTSTKKDKNKKLSKEKSDEYIIDTKRIDYIHSGNLEIDGHIIARSYYDMNIDSSIVIEYKNINDSLTTDSERCLSEWFMVHKSEEKEYAVYSITEISKDKNYGHIFIKSNICENKKLKTSNPIKLYRNLILICGTVEEINDEGIYVKVPIKIYNIAEQSSEEWYNLKNYKVKKDSKVNLLCGHYNNSDFRIDILGSKFISMILGTKNYIMEFDEELSENEWYGIILNISSQLNVNLFTKTNNNKLEKIFENSGKIKLSNSTFDRYYIESSNINLTNIRYYNMGNYDIDKQLTDLVTYNIKNNSKAIINDSADLYLTNDYYGEQR